MKPETTAAELLQDALAGCQNAAGELFRRHDTMLRKVICLRMDRRIQGRVDLDDVIQDIYMEYARCLPDYSRFEQVPFNVWLRMIALRKLQTIHRHHLGTAARSADREISLFRGPLPDVNSNSLAIQLMGRHTSPTQAVVRAELQMAVQAALDEMEPIDREILALRHFEELSNTEVAHILGLTPAAASNRFIRALGRIKKLLDDFGPRLRNARPFGSAGKGNPSGK